MGDWQPHFGYHRSHMASDHLSQYKNTKPTTTLKPLAASLAAIPLDHYVVRLMRHGKLFCSGIIVNQQQVLTASMCVLQVPYREISIKLYDGSQFNVTGHSYGKGFGVGVAIELLSLLNLNKPLDEIFSRAPSICSYRLALGEIVQLWTWNSRQTYLKKKRVPQVPNNQCKKAINDPKLMVLNNATSCVTNTLWTAACQPNVGLPYVHRQSFCGINILGHNCPRFSKADVYVRLLDEKRFISERLNQVRMARLDKFLF